MLEDLRSPFCDEDFDQVEDVVINQFLCSITKDIVHLEGMDVEDEFTNKSVEESKVFLMTV